jgi:hypothetical protein
MPEVDGVPVGHRRRRGSQATLVAVAVALTTV